MRQIGVGVEDLKIACRGCVARPGFSLMVVGMLALGIAGSAAIFGLFDGLFLRPLPFAEPERLVSLDESSPDVDLPYIFIADPDAHAWHRDNTSFESMAFFSEEGVDLAGPGWAEHVRGLQTTAGILHWRRSSPMWRLTTGSPGTRSSVTSSQGAEPRSLLGIGAADEVLVSELR